MAQSNIEQKISESQEILADLGLLLSQQNKIAALTLLALAGIKPTQNWNRAVKRSMTISKDIMEFVNKYYKADYKPNSRESFRKLALKPFIENNFALLNPDIPELSAHSSNTHYSISGLLVETITKYKSQEWESAVERFKKLQFPENIFKDIRISRLRITNFKSIIDEEIELGRFNVFIGSNGSGKSNIIEALATIGAAKAEDLNFEGLYSRGVRIARPDLMASSFAKIAQNQHIDISVNFHGNDVVNGFKSSIYPVNKNDVYTKWNDRFYHSQLIENISSFFKNEYPALKITENHSESDDLVNQVNEWLSKRTDNSVDYLEALAEYGIYDLNTKSLRGTTPIDSRKTPLGLNGEGLDLLISNFNSYEKGYLNKCVQFFDWLNEIVTDKEGKNQSGSLKPGRSSSTLYFTDKFMQRQNNILSAENSNEGILHVLFYIALFISNRTPRIFAIDNIETALNPKMCRQLVLELVKLSKERGKQALITTHNPAVLDGMNLFDDEQRLFEVYRNKEGHTKIKRIQKEFGE